jgi:hypothetical protein
VGGTGAFATGSTGAVPFVTVLFAAFATGSTGTVPFVTVLFAAFVAVLFVAPFSSSFFFSD